MDLAFTYGLMVESMRACGNKENNMAKANIHLPMVKLEEVSGEKEKESNG